MLADPAIAPARIAGAALGRRVAAAMAGLLYWRRLFQHFESAITFVARDVNTPVLVLNQNYEPLNVCNVRRAFVLLDHGKAEMLEEGDGFLRSSRAAYPRPSVIRLVYMIRRPRPQMRLTRREVFQRDRFTCMYCGVQGHDLTLDHVIPRYRGGRHTWENLVSACKRCNHRKAGRTPQEARMHLLREPFHPRASGYYIFYPYLDAQDGWRKFIPGWDEIATSAD